MTVDEASSMSELLINIAQALLINIVFRVDVKFKRNLCTAIINLWINVIILQSKRSKISIYTQIRVLYNLTLEVFILFLFYSFYFIFHIASYVFHIYLAI